MTAVQKLIATIVVLGALVGGIYYFSTHIASAPTTTTGSTSTTTVATSTTTTATTTQSGTSGVSVVTPDATKPIAFSSDISASIRTQLNSQLKTVQNEIAQNPLNPGPWIDLGTLHKIGGDYQNAALYWEYVAATYRGPAVPYLSLGDLYENYLHDYTKAEADYKMAIQNDPQNVNAYADLFTMYHYTLHDDTKAAAILQQGLQANPNNNYLLGLQSNLQSGK